MRMEDRVMSALIPCLQLFAAEERRERIRELMPKPE